MKEIERRALKMTLVAALLMVSACSRPAFCLTEPACPSQPPPPSTPVSSVLQIASFSVVESHIPGDYFCDGFCLTPFVDLVETTGLGRASIKSITVLGYRVVSTTGLSCVVQPGQRLNLVLNDDAWRSDSSMGEERTIEITYDDGTGVAATVAARTLVTSTAPERRVSEGCRLGNAVPVNTVGPSLISTSR